MKKKLAAIFLVFVLICSVLYGGRNVQAGGKVQLSQKKLTLKVGAKKKLKVKGTKKKVKWSSNKKKVVTVSQKGVIKAKKKGKAVITARVGKKKYKCKVTVTNPKKPTESSSTDNTQPTTSVTQEPVSTQTPATQSPVSTQTPDAQNPAVPSPEVSKQPDQTVSPTPASAIPQTGMTQPVPAEYMTAADKQGNVVRIDYDSEDYVRDGDAITKTAYVYTPYGYDEADTETRYNILYLMHGWGGRAGEYFNFTGTKNVFDNLIENGDIPPVIIVSATFYNENSSTDFSSSISEFRQFHLDFENHLMPTVEGQFHAYAQSTSVEDLKASRDHRAFGGFSLGSVTTWLQFCYDYDYIRYFLPMSGSCWYYGTYGDFQTEKNVDFIEQLVKDENLDARGYFIYHTTGTQDTVKSQTLMQAEEMIARADVFTPEHYAFYQKDGGYHDFNAVQEYIYNALPLFFRDAE